MAKPDPDDVTLYDLDPKFQERLLKWLAKTNTVVDIAATPHGFDITFDPGANRVTDGSIEAALHRAMNSRSTKRYIDPEFEQRVHACLGEHSAHLTFGATDDGTCFVVAVASADARGEDIDEDFEVALVIAEDKFLRSLSPHRLPPEERAALEEALVPPAQREEEAEERHERLRRALMEPRPELEANHQEIRPGEWTQVGGDVNPDEYGAVLAELSEDGGSVSLVQIDTDDEKEGWFYVTEGTFWADDLEWGGQAHAESIAATMGLSKTEWGEMTLVERAVDALRYHGAGWGDESGGKHVKGWAKALPAPENKIRWWDGTGALRPNRQMVSYHQWCDEVDTGLRARGMRLSDANAEYWRTLYLAGFTPLDAMREFAQGSAPGEWLAENAHERPPPPRRSRPPGAMHHVRRMVREHDKPFDPEAPRERYARPHHFSVNHRPAKR